MTLSLELSGIFSQYIVKMMKMMLIYLEIIPKLLVRVDTTMFRNQEYINAVRISYRKKF